MRMLSWDAAPLPNASKTAFMKPPSYSNKAGWVMAHAHPHTALRHSKIETGRFASHFVRP
jgi:hypothetical protein